MYLIYKRKDNVIEDCVYRKVYNGMVDVAIGGDFRKGYITFPKEKFEEIFMSGAIKMLKHKPKNKTLQDFIKELSLHC